MKNTSAVHYWTLNIDSARHRFWIRATGVPVTIAEFGEFLVGRRPGVEADLFTVTHPATGYALCEGTRSVQAAVNQATKVLTQKGSAEAKRVFASIARYLKPDLDPVECKQFQIRAWPEVAK